MYHLYSIYLKFGTITKSYNNDIIKSYVGMIIISSTLDTSAKVVAVYGGTSWELIKDRFLLGKGDTYSINSTGGNKEHYHYLRSYIGTNLKNSGLNSLQVLHYGGLGSGLYVPEGANSNYPPMTTVSNMPPYIVVYIWKRVV